MPKLDNDNFIRLDDFAAADPDEFFKQHTGRPFVLSVDFSQPNRSQVPALELLRYQLMDIGIDRENMPSAELGDERWFRLQMPERTTDAEAVTRARCVHITTDRLFFEPVDLEG